METYLAYDFHISPLEPAREILIAELSEVGFESFVEHDTGLLAYIKKNGDDIPDLAAIYILGNPNFQIKWDLKEVAQQNWNAQWEENFSPIQVGDSCMVRAAFHPKEAVAYDIVITPKMSFGTGHHETTRMMLQHILEHDFEGKSVLDMGSGTGVLAILAAKKGAATLEAIDIDTWCYENALENVAQNHCTNIKVRLGDASLIGNSTYDIILANINRNILLNDIPLYAKALQKSGTLFLSGFYKSDLPKIINKCKEFHLQFKGYLEENNWVATVHRFS